MTNKADRGRAAVAEVEEAAFGGTAADLPVDRQELHDRVAAVVGSPWWQQCGPRVMVSTPRRSATSSTARSVLPSRTSRHPDQVDIRLADGQLTLATVAHELGHALAGVAEAHGARFRAAHVDVTALLCGGASADALRAAYGAFELPVAERPWPAPWRTDGDSFRILV